MERWNWKAYYEDGSTLDRSVINPATGRNWSSDHLEFDKLIALTFEPKNNNVPRVVFQIQEKERPRRYWRQYRGTRGFAETAWACELTVDETKFYTYFRPDGTIVLSLDPESSEYPRDPSPGLGSYDLLAPYTGTKVVVDAVGGLYMHMPAPNVSCVLLRHGSVAMHLFFRPDGEILVTTDSAGSFHVA